MKQNMGMMDRLTRLLLAAVFAILFFTGVLPAGIVATLCWVLGTVFFITALIGYCPLYPLLGLRTRKK